MYREFKCWHSNSLFKGNFLSFLVVNGLHAKFLFHAKFPQFICTCPIHHILLTSRYKNEGGVSFLDNLPFVAFISSLKY